MLRLGPRPDLWTKKAVVGDDHWIRFCHRATSFFIRLRTSVLFVASYCKCVVLQRNIPMLLRRILVSLGLQHLQGLNQFLAGLARLDDGVHVATIGGDVGIGEAFAEFFDLSLADGVAILG